MKKRIIPNFVPILLLGIGIIKIAVCFVQHEVLLELVLPYFYGLAIAVLICVLCKVLSKDGLGMGDIKLLAALGFVLGVNSFLKALFVTALLSFLVGVFLLLIHRADKKTTMPFAPFIALGVLAQKTIEIISEVV